jgi:Leucine-rich repeat (LRR) protein
MLTELMFFDSIEENELGKLRNLYINDNRIKSMNGIGKLTGLVKLDLCNYFVI